MIHGNRRFLDYIQSMMLQDHWLLVVAVKLKEKVQHLAVVVVRKHDFPLFGLDWCLNFGLELPSVVRLDSVNQLVESHKSNLGLNWKP